MARSYCMYIECKIRRIVRDNIVSMIQCSFLHTILPRPGPVRRRCDVTRIITRCYKNNNNRPIPLKKSPLACRGKSIQYRLTCHFLSVNCCMSDNNNDYPHRYSLNYFNHHSVIIINYPYSSYWTGWNWKNSFVRTSRGPLRFSEF
jgi:hypothetical protein